MKKPNAKNTGQAKKINVTKTPADPEDNMPDDALESALARGKERYGHALKTGPSVAIPRPDLPPDTNESFDRAREDLKVIFEAAARGSKDAMRNLFTLAWKATADLVALNELEGTRIGIESASPLVERQATLQEILRGKTQWPAIIQEPDKNEIHSFIKASMPRMRFKMPGFDRKPKAEKVEIVSSFLRPLFDKNEIKKLIQRELVVMEKRKEKLSARLKKRRTKLRDKIQKPKKVLGGKSEISESGIDETRLQILNTRIEKAENTQRKPNKGERMEALKDIVREDLTDLSP